MKLGFAIQRCRHLKRMTMTELASAAGLSLSYLSLLEKGKRDDPSMNALERISAALGLPLSLLILLASEEENSSFIDGALIDELKRTTEEMLSH